MSLSKTNYRAEIANVSADGKYIRILRDVESPFADELPDHVERLNEEQARQLRDSLNEVLGRL